MFKRNMAREDLITDLYNRGNTIDQISLITGIPRSSVGYYVKKNKKKGNYMGRTSQRKVRSTLDRAQLLLLSTDVINRFDILWKQSKYHEIKEMFETYFAYIQISDYISMLETSNEETQSQRPPVKKGSLEAALDKIKEEVDQKGSPIL